MKIAFLFRGPIRPSHLACLENIRMMLSNFQGYNNITTHLWTWDSLEAKRLLKVFQFNSSCLYPEPTITEVENNLKKMNVSQRILEKRWATNSYKQYFSMREAIKFVGTDADFIVQTRSDAAIKLAEISKWLDSTNYVTSHTKASSGRFTNDQMGVAPPCLMAKAWEYNNIETLGKFFNNSSGPSEEVLDQIMEMNKVPSKIAPIEYWKLNPNRHHGEHN